ncbi:Angio-associated migratory cell protein [Giardia muris]|uniref:Angio-associated migratory cell protein n=1 Tax=Giardia muris TaxID=5742 RepID=A0A4Z1SXE0_GIAMU|nr:Angio-associated migratory cell protein [Giardia muris]|eukprot:TNJ30394.1 Angio-associated migratory cell protein [Giardia muris]
MSGYDDELNNIETQNNIPEDLVISGLMGIVPVASDDILAVATSSSGLIAVGGLDETVYLLDGAGSNIATFAGCHKESVTAVTFSRCGRYVFSGGLDGKVNCFDTNTLQLVGSIEGPTAIEWLTLFSRKNRLVVGSDDGTVWFFDFTQPTTPLIGAVIAGQVGAITCGAVIKNNRFVVGSQDGTVRLIDPTQVATGRSTILGSIQLGAGVICLRFLPSHNGSPQALGQAVIGCEDGSLYLLTLSERGIAIVSTVHDHEGSIEFVEIYEKYLIAGGTDGNVIIYDLQHSLSLRCALHLAVSCTQAVCTKNGVIFIGMSNGVVAAFDIRSGNKLFEFDAFLANKQLEREADKPVLALALYREEEAILVGGDQALVMWATNPEAYDEGESVDVSTTDEEIGEQPM